MSIPPQMGDPLQRIGVVLGRLEDRVSHLESIEGGGGIVKTIIEQVTNVINNITNQTIVQTPVDTTNTDNDKVLSIFHLDGWI